jgi:hypothetical protein
MTALSGQNDGFERTPIALFSVKKQTPTITFPADNRFIIVL